MKKFFLPAAFFCAFLTASLANAKDGFQIGADLVLSNAKYKQHDKSGYATSPYSVGKVDGDGVGVGLSAGYKKSFDQAFVTPEIFYDYLNTSTKDYYHITEPYQQDEMALRARYGAKANLGYDFSDKFSAYLTYGLANVSYINRGPSIDFSEGKSTLSPIYGLGALFQINENWAVKAEFNQQKLHLRYGASSYDSMITSKVTLNVLKTGLVYSF